MWSLVCLGTYNAEKARDLGILSILTDKPAEEAVKVRRATAVEASEKEASKFQLGATTPVLSARIVNRILWDDFVDMAEFSEANLELEMRNSAVADEGKASSKGKLPPIVPSLASLAKRFCLSVGVSAHPEKAKNMFTYMALILFSEVGPCGECGTGTIAVSDSSFLPSSQLSSGSSISRCILRLWLCPVIEGVCLQWSRRLARSAQSKEVKAPCVFCLERCKNMCGNSMQICSCLLQMWRRA